MEGLQSIQDRILEQARTQADEIIAQSERQCQAIIESARQEVHRIEADAQSKTSARVEAMLNRARSMAALERRKRVLQKRQTLIDQVIETALRNTGRLEDDRKVDLYARMIRQSGARKGIITLSESDLHLAGLLLAQVGADFTVRGEPGRFTAGLVLQRDRIEDNLTFDLIVRNQRPQLAALAAGSLPETLFREPNRPKEPDAV